LCDSDDYQQKVNQISLYSLYGVSPASWQERKSNMTTSKNFTHFNGCIRGN